MREGRKKERMNTQWPRTDGRHRYTRSKAEIDARHRPGAGAGAGGGQRRSQVGGGGIRTKKVPTTTTKVMESTSEGFYSLSLSLSLSFSLSLSPLLGSRVFFPDLLLSGAGVATPSNFLTFLIWQSPVGRGRGTHKISLPPQLFFSFSFHSGTNIGK